MRNVANAYKQTQAETTGQGEVIIMLFDGALRFLAQAREKMLAKDYAAKGVLISRTLDIIHELDGSLNMEVGGDLAANLHNLYFLCTTKLLQANLRLDTDQLDSVVDTLSGLRGAFAQTFATAEAQAALQSRPQAVSQTSPRPLMTTREPGSAPRGIASLYSQQGQQEQQGQQSQQGAQSAPFAAKAPEPVAASSVIPGAAPAAQAQPESPAAAPQAPPSGFSAKRLGAYARAR